MTQMRIRNRKQAHKAPEPGSFPPFSKITVIVPPNPEQQTAIPRCACWNIFSNEEARMLKKLMISTALSAVMVTAAFAQSPNTPASPSASPSPPPAAQSQDGGKNNFVTSQKPDQWLATKFKGTD